jgi:ATP-dependent RNA helicase RhlE
LDEADRMLDMGFEPQIKRILAKVPTDRQTMLFSATMPNEIIKIATSYMKIPVRVEVAPTGTTVQEVTQEVFFVNRDQKVFLLAKVLAEHKGSILVFTRTKFGAKKIALAVRNMGYTASEIHSNRSLSQRREALDGFKIGKYRVLVATDIAARGIDVVGIELVVNYDLPENPGDYVHRIGRTARAGLTGKAVSFATPDQRYDVKSIERLIRSVLPIKQLPEFGGIKRDFVPAREPRHNYIRKINERSKPNYRTNKYKSRPFVRHDPNRPQDHGFDAHRIRYRDDRNSY